MWLTYEVQMYYVSSSPLITQCEDKGTGHRTDFDAMDSLKIYHEKILTFDFIRHFHTLSETHPIFEIHP